MRELFLIMLLPYWPGSSRAIPTKKTLRLTVFYTCLLDIAYATCRLRDVNKYDVRLANAIQSERFEC